VVRQHGRLEAGAGGGGLAVKVMELLEAAGLPAGVVNLLCGDRCTSEILISSPLVDAVSLTGSEQAGLAAQAICAGRGVPFQAELGGNNPAIVWADADHKDAARQIAEGAFGMAGQRCTANRRAIVDERCYDDFLRLLEQATAELVWGDPSDPRTQVGPLISREHRNHIASLIGRAQPASRISVPHEERSRQRPFAQLPSYYPPTIVCCDDPGHEVVQEETFGPVLVVQRAANWQHALDLCNGVRQGLAAALFSSSPQLRQQFLQEAQAGILKINRTTADAEVDVPFGGWKASGIGPAEHGDCDREFYTRTQTLYEG
jgi:alpha-ketoglutaric semialdehyde dehydrogenase